MEAEQIESTIVVMEAGSDWPAWIGRLRPGATTRAIAQQAEESPAELADRIVAKMDDVDARGDAFGVAVIACGERTDAAAERARRLMATALLSSMAKNGGGRLLVAASDRRSGGSRRSLSDMATDLELEWEDADVSVNVRFGQPARRPHHAWASPAHGAA